MLLPICISILATADTPTEIGRRELDLAAGAKRSSIVLSVKKGGPKESFSIEPRGGKILIEGADPAGAMYGAFEFAERLRNKGANAWKTKMAAKPFMSDRGVNLFLTLPWNYAKNDTDYEVDALTDPKRWWFQNDDYWTTLLDLMAHSRLNWLDIHGAWDISVTNAPNLYAYFVTSPSFPQVGVPQTVKDANLARLNRVIEMAHARGIRVSLMAYEANLRVPQNPNPPYQATEANVYKYTSEAVESMIRKAPGLDAIGFRIGESGRSESFFNCYLEAVKNSGREIPLITRSWITRKQKVLPLARASKDFTVEIKYNGEQWGAPYPVAGGRMANWSSYSFEDYLSDSSRKSDIVKVGGGTGGMPPSSTWPARTWPGLPATGGGHWPDQPYKVVWQVRANGTHRIFPFYNPDWVRRSIKAMPMGTASGYTIEGLDAYYPKEPDYYLANPQDKYCRWIHQRDELYWTTWGRLGYDPKTPDSTFDAMVRRRFGSQGKEIAEAWKVASKIIPLAFMAYSLGPDHRNHAPELETGGNYEAFIQNEPFDTLLIRSALQSATLSNWKRNDGRLPLSDLGREIRDRALEVRAKLLNVDFDKIPAAEQKRFKELNRATTLLTLLGYYYSGRLEGADQLAMTEQLVGSKAASPNFLEDMSNMSNSMVPFGNGGPGDYYKPFTERLRMGTNNFHWRNSEQSLANEQTAIKSWPKTEKNAQTNRLTIVPPDCRLSWKASGHRVVCTVTGKDVKKAWLLVKPLPSSTFFHKQPMARKGDSFVLEVPRERHGLCLSAEALIQARESDVGSCFVDANGKMEVTKGKSVERLVRIGWQTGDERNYQVVPAQPGLTPQIYSTEESLAYLRSSILNPESHGMMLIAPRAWQTFNWFDSHTKRKLLEPVIRGMKLVILQQDYVSGRYKLDWMPNPPRVENSPTQNVFDPGGALSLLKMDTEGILWQRFLPTPGWEVPGNGGIAHRKYGQGEIWMINARLMQRATNPKAAQAIRKILELNGRTKPLVLVDAGTEGAPFTTSFWPDMMNALDIPFLTLGEVIAKEQGMDSFTVVHGSVGDDDVLAGKGKEIANRYLKGEVVRLAKRPTAASVPAFEDLRKSRKAELLKSLGLDPMPAKTPLNARITGTIPRNGYRIEKVVFESRPNFFVTAHVYVPDRAAKHPVIVHVNGHWAHKKGEDRLQLRSAFSALSGYITITIDTPGWSFEGNSLIERRAEGDHNDFKLVQGGSNTTGYYVWDAIRALDYMATRSDTDMNRVGITGASGGGLATLYTFAADDRYKAAVPVVYMSSMELAPDNGCLCNHVPATMLIGDRSDVIAIQAPKPVLIMGAEVDGEFPPDAMRLTQKKMAETWKLFGKDSDTYVKIFAGGHDYSQPMRESMIGFFDRYLKGQGDGSPVAQPKIEILDPEDRQILVLDPPPAKERTMRDLSKEYLDNASKVVNPIELNGGLPRKTALNYKEIGDGRKRFITFDSEPGLTTPGILVGADRKVSKVRIVVSDKGKATALEIQPNSRDRSHPEFATLYLDTLGIGEFRDAELRYAVYLGRSVPFIAGWQIARAAEAMRKYASDIEIVGEGPISSQSVMWAALMDPTISHTTGTECLKTWADVFDDKISPYAVQPRAHLLGSLESLRAKVKNGMWR